MGSGSYRSSDWAKLSKSKGISTESSYNEIFTSGFLNEKYDPKFIDKRYSLDSEEHPESTPIIIGFDVTGSMGYLAAQIAKESLNELMMKLYSTDDVKDPQLMFAAMGDQVDKAPLQVTQFESDIRIAEQLMDLWLEGRGGDSPEDYPLLWYFASEHTHIDSFEKRGKKGFLVTIGDADCHQELSSSVFKKVFGDKVSIMGKKSAALAEAASRKYELIHINIKHHAGEPTPSVIASAIPGRVVSISKNEVSILPELIITLIGILSGKKLDEALSSFTKDRAEIVRKIVAGSGFTEGSDSIVF